MISGEYFVLDGALALALPTQVGQQLQVQEAEGIADRLYWQSLDSKGQAWLDCEFDLAKLSLISSSDQKMGQRLSDLFLAARQLAPDFLTSSSSLKATTRLEFPRDWGLGTSSTLVQLLADWAGVNPYHLLAATFGGSGYDIACAGAEGPLLYQLEKGQPRSKPIAFAPSFQEQLYFVYLGQKQNSREGIAHYRQRQGNVQGQLDAISALTHEMIACKTLPYFEQLIQRHEDIIASVIDLPRAFELYFANYWGQVKSLGAWGGDFVLLTSDRSEVETRAYCNEKGFEVFIPYKELIL